MRIALNSNMAQNIADDYRERWEAAGSLGLYQWYTACDNYLPVSRRDAYGVAIKHRQPSAPDYFGWSVYGLVSVDHHWYRCGYILDFGTEVIPTHVAAFHPTEGYGKAIVHPYPLNDGRKREDNGKEVDYWNWSLGPRKTYHLKMTEIRMP